MPLSSGHRLLKTMTSIMYSARPVPIGCHGHKHGHSRPQLPAKLNFNVAFPSTFDSEPRCFEFDRELRCPFRTIQSYLHSDSTVIECGIDGRLVQKATVAFAAVADDGVGSTMVEKDHLCARLKSREARMGSVKLGCKK